MGKKKELKISKRRFLEELAALRESAVVLPKNRPFKDLVITTLPRPQLEVKPAYPPPSKPIKTPEPIFPCPGVINIDNPAPIKPISSKKLKKSIQYIT
jgi:hypothetical protein